MLPIESVEVCNSRVSFEHYFEIVPALSPPLIDEVFRIRHRVYCEELGFEPLRPDGRETDRYDAQSLHLLIRCVKTGQFVGCTRLIRARPHDPEPLLPVEHACALWIDCGHVDPSRMPRHSVGEISRLSVIGAYRNRRGEQHKAAALSGRDFGTGEKPRFPYILVGLYLGIIELARLHGIETLFVLTEPRLARHLGRIGVEIQPIGAGVEHHGTRLPSIMHTREIIASLKPLFRPLFERIAKEIASASARTRFETFA